MADRELPEDLARRLDSADGIGADELHEALDALDDEGRIVFTRSLNKGRQERLWELVEGHMPGRTGLLVPDDIAPGATVIFEGRNSMPMFNLFQKRFTRPEESDEIWGYNHQAMAWFTGPGYFVVDEDPDRGVLVFDYDRLPERALDGWPALRPNTGFPPAVVYGNMYDEVRPVSGHILIGKMLLKQSPDKGAFSKLIDSTLRTSQMFTICRHAVA